MARGSLVARDMDSLLSDLRYAVRTLLKSPGFTLVAVVTLALGIGATTAIFSVVNGVLLRPLPYAAPDRLVVVWESNQRGAPHNVVSPANFLDWRDRARSFGSMGILSWSGLTMTGDRPEHVRGLAVSTNLLGVLGVRPLLGRTFVPSDADSGGARTLVLSYGLWARRFGADPAIVGKSVAVAGGFARVVGVMPRGFRPLWHEDYWEPFPLTPQLRRHSGRYTVVVARLKDEVGVGQAQAEMTLITRGLEQDYPAFNTGWSATVVPLTEQVVGEARRPLLMLLGAVAFVLLIACANVGNLLLARAAARQREVAVRSALGASRGRLVQLWVVECLLLAGIGAGFGVVLASWGVELLKALAPDSVPRLGDVALDGRVVAFTAGVALVSAVLLAVATVRSAAGREPAGALRAAAGRATAGRAAGRFRGGLVAAQVSLAVVLLVGAGLLMRSLTRLLAVDPGFDPAHVVTTHIALPDLTYPQPTRQAAFWSQLLERVRSRPGVQAAGVVAFLPLAGARAATGFTVVGQPSPAPGSEPVTDIQIADRGYFTTMRIPLLEGRLFTGEDGPGSPEVALVNETFAKRTWPGEVPIGKRVKVSWTHPDAEVTVVGVVGDVRSTGFDAAVQPTLYYDLDQDPHSELTVVVRSTATPAALLGELRAAVRALDVEVPVGAVSAMNETVAESMLDRRFPMQLLALFAGLAVVLAAVGIYGLLAYTVRLRTREIGVRLVLGARSGAVVRMILATEFVYVLAGLAVGCVAALAAASVLRGLLFGIATTDLATYVAVALLLVSIALIASWLPARRAARVDPVVALRSE